MRNPIRSYREKYGLTLEAFGDLIGSRKGSVSKWEAGQPPSIITARSIEQVTNGEITRGDLRPDVLGGPDGAPVALNRGAAA